jgi:hypothetical protein
LTNGDPFLSVTGHYINAPVDHPYEWELKCEQLAFTQIEGNHLGANMASILVHTVDHYGIHDKVFFHSSNVFSYLILNIVQSSWFTADNASSNDTTLKEFGKIIDPNELCWDPVEQHIR